MGMFVHDDKEYFVCNNCGSVQYEEAPIECGFCGSESMTQMTESEEHESQII